MVSSLAVGPPSRVTTKLPFPTGPSHLYRGFAASRHGARISGPFGGDKDVDGASSEAASESIREDDAPAAAHCRWVRIGVGDGDGAWAKEAGWATARWDNES